MVANASPPDFTDADTACPTIISFAMPSFQPYFGTTHACIGPVHIPACAGGIIAFQPRVNTRVIHHIALYGSDRKLDAPAVNSLVLRNSSSIRCYGEKKRLLYIWARAGRDGMSVRTEHPSEFRLPAGTGYTTANGGKEGLEWLYLNIHYENTGIYVADTSGVDVELIHTHPLWPVSVTMLQCVPLRIPPGNPAFRHSCSAGQVARGGEVLFFRNHAHQAGGRIWSEVLRGSSDAGELGSRSAQEAQVFTAPLAPAVTALKTGDRLTLNCVFNTSGRNFLTSFGFQEDRQEMCLQFLIMNSSASIVPGAAGVRRTSNHMSMH